jgi:hypothetical protein
MRPKGILAVRVGSFSTMVLVLRLGNVGTGGLHDDDEAENGVHVHLVLSRVHLFFLGSRMESASTRFPVNLTPGFLGRGRGVGD